jgi:hypothetical protein
MGILLRLVACVFEGRDACGPQMRGKTTNGKQGWSQLTPEGRLREERLDSIGNWVR